MRLASSSYTPRRPHETVLHQLVRKHLATFLEHTGATYAAPLPFYVVEAFERYLACGDFSRGFVRCRCEGCGHDVCAVRIAAEDDEGRERLLRYCARPPFALDRIEELSDGRVAYAMKTPRRGSTHRVMTPVEFLGRLAILVPPPYFPLVRYHGVFAARSSWRARVTPKPPDGVARRKKSKRCPSDTPSPSAPAAPRASSTNAAPPAPTSEPASPVTAPSTARAIPLPRALEDPTTLTLKHWGRILEGELFATSSRIDWAVLLQRTFGFDALRCTTCNARMRIVATINDPVVAKKILAHVGVSTEPLPRARARDPTGQMDFGDYAA